MQLHLKRLASGYWFNKMAAEVRTGLAGASTLEQSNQYWRSDWGAIGCCNFWNWGCIAVDGSEIRLTS